jgi:hypothetical protein
MRFSLRTMMSGARSSISRFSRLFRLMTRRYRSFRSEVAKRPAVQRHQRAQLGRDHRHDVEDHPLRPGAGFAEGLDQLQALDQLLALRLGGGLLQLGAQARRFLLHVHGMQDFLHRLGADADAEAVLAELVLLGGELVLVQQRVQLEVGQAGLEHHVGLEVQDLLQLLQRHVDHQADAARQGLQEPDVGDGRGQLDMAHALAPDLGQRHLDAALLADDAAELHALVLAAQALVVLDRAEDAGAEQPVPLRLEGAVVDRLGLLDLAVGPGADLLRRRDRDLDLIERRRLTRLAEDLHQLVHGRPFSVQPTARAGRAAAKGNAARSTGLRARAASGAAVL